MSKVEKMATGLGVNSLSANMKIETGKEMIRVGVLGYGYWGPNIVRNFHGQDKSRVVAVCDKSSKSLDRVRHAFPDVRTTNDCKELLTSPDIDAVAVVTPVWTHFELAKTALENAVIEEAGNGSYVSPTGASKSNPESRRSRTREVSAQSVPKQRT